jgi:hypothetical protein
VNYGRTISTPAKTFLGGLSLLAVVSAFSQTQTPAQSRVVPLVSNACPSVRIGDSVSLDWNPLFDPIWPVTGLRGFGLRFAPVAADGSTLKKGELLLRPGESATRISPLENGYFHLEFTVNLKTSRPGTYRLVGANAAAEVVPDYAEQPPRMTNSPVDQRYCFTVVGSPALQSPQTGS